MEHKKEIEDRLGKTAVQVLLEEIENGKIDRNKMKQIALKMDGKVHGVFVQKSREGWTTDVDVFRYCLDSWYTCELYRLHVDPNARLREVLEEVGGLGPLVQKLFGPRAELTTPGKTKVKPSEANAQGIERVLSAKQIKIILDFVDRGNMTEDNMGEMAKMLGPAAQRTFYTERNSKPRLLIDRHLFRKILDSWFNGMMIDERENALEKFVEICKKVQLNSLAVDIESCT